MGPFGTDSSVPKAVSGFIFYAENKWWFPFIIGPQCRPSKKIRLFAYYWSPQRGIPDLGKLQVMAASPDLTAKVTLNPKP